MDGKEGLIEGEREATLTVVEADSRKVGGLWGSGRVDGFDFEYYIYMRI